MCRILLWSAWWGLWRSMACRPQRRRQYKPTLAFAKFCFTSLKRTAFQHAWEMGVQLLRRETKATGTLLRMQAPGVTPPSFASLTLCAMQGQISPWPPVSAQWSLWVTNHPINRNLKKNYKPRENSSKYNCILLLIYNTQDIFSKHLTYAWAILQWLR